MKIAVSSAPFARALAEGALTHLEWIDLCAQELEADGVLFDAAHFPRTDAEYLAQCKKLCIDLGLAVAGVAADARATAEGVPWVEAAARLGAPLLVVRAPAASDDPGARQRFTDELKVHAGEAKRATTALALRPAAGTLCASVADCKAIAKDVDSSWLRYAFDASDLGALEDPHALLARSAVAFHAVADLERFGAPGDTAAERLIAGLARFRGFLVLDAAADDRPATDPAFHAAIARFAELRAAKLAAA